MLLPPSQSLKSCVPEPRNSVCHRVVQTDAQDEGRFHGKASALSANMFTSCGPRSASQLACRARSSRLTCRPRTAPAIGVRNTSGIDLNAGKSTPSGSEKRNARRRQVFSGGRHRTACRGSSCRGRRPEGTECRLPPRPRASVVALRHAGAAPGSAHKAPRGAEVRT